MTPNVKVEEERIDDGVLYSPLDGKILHLWFPL